MMSRYKKRRSNKLGRNDPCHCGSGKKYKKCCLHKDAVKKRNKESNLADHDTIAKVIAQHRAKDSLRRSIQGEGKPIISTDFKGYKFVAVGNQLHFAPTKSTQTFIDFLGNYIKQVLDPEWGNAEIAKPIAERHPILKWYNEVCLQLEKHINPDEKISSMPVTGVLRAYYGLAYNLYLLQHNVEIQNYLIKRLKQKDSFYGAYYETYVAAWFILAGFTLKLENEQDGSSTHCEFSATAKSGNSYSVEAKTREPGKNHMNVGNQLYWALTKKADYDRIVFIDMNIPQGFDGEHFFNEITRCIYTREDSLTIKGDPAPPAYVVVSNHPYHHHLLEENIGFMIQAEGYKIPDFGNTVEFPSLIDAYKARMKHADIRTVLDACQHYKIPITFDGELPEFEFGEAERRFIIGETYELDKETKGILIIGTVNEHEKMAYLICQLDNGEQALYTATLSDAEISAYRQHPETFFGRVTNTVTKAETAIDLFMFFYNSYKETPREKILDFFKEASDLVDLKKLSTDELRLKYGPCK